MFENSKKESVQRGDNMKTKLLIKLSLIMDKMGIASEISKIEGETNEEIAKKILGILISKIYRAEDEIYELISEFKSISLDDAKEVDIIPIIKELIVNADVKSFLKLQ